MYPDISSEKHFFPFKQSFHFTSLHFIDFSTSFVSLHIMSCHVIPFISFSMSFPFIYLRGSFHFIYCCISFHSHLIVAFHLYNFISFQHSKIAIAPLTPLISHQKPTFQNPPLPLSRSIIFPPKSLGLDIVASHQITTLSTFR